MSHAGHGPGRSRTGTVPRHKFSCDVTLYGSGAECNCGLPERNCRYFVGDELRHHAGDVWRVVEADLPGDGGFHGGMIELAGDYRIECVRGREAGSTRRVHADYLHGNGWTRVPSGVLR